MSWLGRERTAQWRRGPPIHHKPLWRRPKCRTAGEESLATTEIAFKAIAGVGCAVFGALVLAGGPRRRTHVFLAMFLFLIATNQLLEALRVASPSVRLNHETAFRGAILSSALDPVLLYAFAAYYPKRNRLARPGRLGAVAVVAVGLAGWTFLLPGPREVYGFEHLAFDALLSLFTVAVYCTILVSWIRSWEPQVLPGREVLIAAMAFATVPVFVRVAIAMVSFWAFGLDGVPHTINGAEGTWAKILVTGLWTAVMLPALGLAVWIMDRANPAGHHERRVARWSLAAAGLAILINLRPLGDLLNYLGWSPWESGEWFRIANYVGASVRWLLFAAFVSVGVLRYDILGLSFPVRRFASRLLVGLAFVFAALLLLSIANDLMGVSATSLTALELAVLGGALLLSQGLRTLVESTATRVFGVPRRGDHGSAIAAYEAALAQAADRQNPRLDEARLRQLQRELGLDLATLAHIGATKLSSSDGPLVAGALLQGRYRIERLLGRGGSGRVFLATDELLHRSVVVKEVPRDDDQGYDVALAEARTAGRLQHPSVVTLHDVIQLPGRSLLVSEYVSGGSLEDRIRERGPLVHAAALRLADDLLAGLAAVHAEGIVHRDLKPANILLQPNGTAKIADFGVARVRQGVTIAPGNVSEFAGTPEYMAPEQRRGEPVDETCDIYAVGCILERCARKPLPDAVERVLRKAQQGSPKGRWKSAESMRRALRRASLRGADGRSIRPTPGTSAGSGRLR